MRLPRVALLIAFFSTSIGACSKENNITLNSNDGPGGAGGAGPACAADGSPSNPPVSYSPCDAPGPSKSCLDLFGTIYGARVSCPAGGKPPAAGCCLQKDVDDWCCPVQTACTVDGNPTAVVTTYDPCPQPSANPTCIDASGGKLGKGTICPAGKSPPVGACCVPQSGDFYCCP